ncbi:hypothetical protein D3879_17230 [Pseudomonas cavernicola]|uniref:Lipoprotein n=1 Tax=Pseudomonas cavernicola TaxID=2320866 RepID=A0A418XBB5_9PSED|nr:hypothetical protein [Pseudomonas cavernicola]RJG09805.1 hypothetical protein D3879_17230 [Pseudomonas cavernicola]
MKTIIRLGLASLVLGLAGCAVPVVQQPIPQEPRGTQQPPSTPAPSTKPRSTQQPSQPIPPQPQPSTRMKAHPHFAPPPGASSYWDSKLGVYVLEGAEGIYYRQRTYYRWNNGWSWASNPQGPWQPTDSSGVPPGLSRQYP